MLALEPNAQISVSTKSSWKHLDEKTVMDRLKELKDDENLINQGANGLCGEATFFHHIIKLARDKFFEIGESLFRDGVCRIGKLKINPRPKLLKADYPTIKAAYVPEPPNFTTVPPQADWMLLTALRDSENFWSHDYEGRPDQTTAEGSIHPELYRWYRKSGLYKNDELDQVLTPLNVTPLQEIELATYIKKTDSNHISLEINEAMIRTGFDGEHVISLESVLEVNVDGGWVKFTYWSWGHPIHSWNDFLGPNHVMTIHDFITHLRGAIIAPY